MAYSSDGKMFFFFGRDNPLSNWHPAGFTIKGIYFCQMECFMMYCKAMLFSDYLSAVHILDATDPREHKRLGRLVKNFDEAAWINKREMYVFKGCLAKFQQNPMAAAYLLSTGDAILVEASRHDKIWGVGLAETDKGVADASQWEGLNLLGNILMRVRTKLKEN